MPKKKKVIEGGGTMLAGGCDDHEKKTAVEEDWFPPTKKMPCKPIKSDGDAMFCTECNANTTYKNICVVCGIKPEEIRLKHIGEINYLREKYPLYCR